MACFYFGERKEALYFCDVLTEKSPGVQINWKGTSHFGNEITLLGTSDNNVEVVIKEILIDMLYMFRMNNWNRDIVEHTYYFHDEHEIRRLLEIREEFDTDPPRGVRLPAIRSDMGAYIQTFIENADVIHFQELASRCFRAVKSSLEDYIGCTIDEYKREEDYQLWLDSLRLYINQGQTEIEELMLYHRHRKFTYYHQNGLKLSQTDVQEQLKHHPLVMLNEGYYDWQMTPALAFAPRKLTIYTDDRGDAKIQTLANIFQEKARYQSIQQFPFARI
ncbi:sporulation protein YtxC [Thalassobacillus sp. CUG 92003]|uniref:sporulation protein YtxC n=1 Tax=Thalassobacillus sp. CUG 92003 TaxID=2736641 RepID=UPI0015E67603|nr:sporulation protein YtxC [Thalassobacillus sp. CUG 92003]